MKIKKLLLLTMAALAVLTACKDEPMLALDEQQNVEAQAFNDDLPSDGMMVLGQELQDPYKLSNMQQAYANITGAKAQLQPTHRYMRFLPKNEEELYLLKNIELFDFPLHYEIIQNGDCYHDPELPADAITWQYAVIPIDTRIPENIQQELIYEVFIPNYDTDGSKSGLLEAIEDEALRLCGYSDMLQQNASKGLFSKWTPSGTIKVWDDVLLKYIPIHGAKVQVRWLTHIEKDFTDANGNFSTSSFRFDVNYAIKWERADFDIRSGNWGQAWYNGPKLGSAWYLNIDKGGMSWVYAHIFRAVHMYYYGHSNWGIKSPPKDGKLFKQSIKIGAMDKSGTSHYFDFNKFFTTPQIKIYRYDGDRELQSIELFGTTIHELAHASHWEMGYSYGQYVVDYIFRKAIIPESWASCVEYVVTNDIYTGSLTFKHWSSWDYEKYSDLQSFTISDFKEYGYTPLFIDCIDVQNQRNTKGELYPIDNVSGYTLAQIENVLFWSYQQLSPTAAIDPIGVSDPIGLIYNSFGLRIIRNNLKTMYNNPTSGYVDELFDNYLEKEK